MPELPEVETVVRDLKKRVVGRRILDVWTDWPNYFLDPKSRIRGIQGKKKLFLDFKKNITGRKIVNVERRGKNILIHLSGSYLILIHLKMTGHPLLGCWRLEGGGWKSIQNSKEMQDSKNAFIRLIFFLDGKKVESMLALSDMRRFAKVLCGPKDEILNLKELKGLGPEALEVSLGDFKKIFETKKGAVKSVLMDQSFVVGIGNIYSDEILYLAGIHPLSRVEKIKGQKIKILLDLIKKVLRRGIKLRGTSSDDFRDTFGKKGGYGKVILVYQRHGLKCEKGHKIERTKVGGRSAHFCPECQELIK
jgi:formamidopyrimidine-DNA glycosylase